MQGFEMNGFQVHPTKLLKISWKWVMGFNSISIQTIINRFANKDFKSILKSFNPKVTWELNVDHIPNEYSLGYGASYFLLGSALVP